MKQACRIRQADETKGSFKNEPLGMHPVGSAADAVAHSVEEDSNKEEDSKQAADAVL